jgi:hypothetical protein
MLPHFFNLILNIGESTVAATAALCSTRCRGRIPGWIACCAQQCEVMDFITDYIAATWNTSTGDSLRESAFTLRVKTVTQTLKLCHKNRKVLRIKGKALNLINENFTSEQKV